MAIQATERIWYTLIDGGLRKTGKAATLKLRIVRSKDALMLDWSDLAFKGSGWTTLNQAAAEHDATNNKGAYYWTVGSGSPVDHILPPAFIDGEYLLEVEESTLNHHRSFPVFIRARRLPQVVAAMQVSNDKTLAEGAVANYKLMEDDGVTVFVQKDVQDKSGGSVQLQPGVPAKEI